MQDLKTIAAGEYLFHGASGTKYRIMRSKNCWVIHSLDAKGDIVKRHGYGATLGKALERVKGFPCMTVNMMTKKPVQITEGTPWCCNPASESYWSS